MKKTVQQLKREEIGKTLGTLVVCIMVGYLVLSCVVFKFRHPYLTETEEFLHLRDALTWKQLRYEDLRPRTEGR